MCVCEWCVVVVCSQVSMGLSSPWLSLCSSFTMCCAHVPISPVNQSLCRAASFTAVTAFPLVANTDLVRLSTWVKAPSPQCAGQSGCIYPWGPTYIHIMEKFPYAYTSKNVSGTGTHTENTGYPLPFSQSALTDPCYQGGLQNSQVSSMCHFSSPQCVGRVGLQRHHRQGRLLLWAAAAEQNGAEKSHLHFP